VTEEVSVGRSERIITCAVAANWGYRPIQPTNKPSVSREEVTPSKSDDETIGGLARPMLRGVARLRFKFTLTMAAYDLIRLPNLLGSPA
jgi:hypothetical protein